jgi:hypothetical protein
MDAICTGGESAAIRNGWERIGTGASVQEHRYRSIGTVASVKKVSVKETSV